MYILHFWKLDFKNQFHWPERVSKAVLPQEIRGVTPFLALPGLGGPCIPGLWSYNSSLCHIASSSFTCFFWGYIWLNLGPTSHDNMSNVNTLNHICKEALFFWDNIYRFQWLNLISLGGYYPINIIYIFKYSQNILHNNKLIYEKRLYYSFILPVR